MASLATGGTPRDGSRAAKRNFEARNAFRLVAWLRFLFARGLAVPANSTPKPVTREQILTERKAVDISNAAAYLGVSHKTIRRLIAAGKLPAYRVGGGGPIRVLIFDVESLKEPIRPQVV